MMVRRIIEQHILGGPVPAEFAVLDHRFDALRAEFLAKDLPIVLSAVNTVSLSMFFVSSFEAT